MPYEITLLGEPLPTLLALEVLDPGVCEFMFGQRTLVGEAFTTLLTLEQLLARMAHRGIQLLPTVITVSVAS